MSGPNFLSTEINNRFLVNLHQSILQLSKIQITTMDPQVKFKSKNIIQDFTPRDYQVEIAEAAIKENVVACLGTGTGKTFIAVMLIKELAYQIDPPLEQNGKRTFFLVPTVPLVHQQHQVLEEHLPQTVGKYFGDMKVDFWSKEQWNDEFSKYQILVMTAEIFRVIIEHGFLPLSNVNLIIFDECHRAVKNHPYRAIMRNFETCKEPPKVLGLTASILNGKCRPGQLENKMKDLEATMRSRAIVPKNMANMQKYGTKPKEMLVSYKEFEISGGSKTIETILVKILRELPDSVDTPVKSRVVDSDDDSDSEGYQPYRNAKKYMIDVLDVLKNLGQWCARETMRVFLKEIHLTIERGLLESMVLAGLKTVESAFELSMSLLDQQINESEESYLFGQHCHPKLLKLLEIIKSKNPLLYTTERNSEKLCAVIFVQKRLVAFILNQWFQELQKFPEFEFIHSNFMVGHGSQMYITEIKEICMASKQQGKMLKLFREGTYNLLIASSVIEEGMDVPHCNIIVRFDPPSDFRAYVQSKGRARARNSVYLLMTPEGDERIKLIGDVSNYNAIEKILQHYCNHRELPTEEEINEHMADEVMPPYMPFPENGGARVTMSSAISLVNRYCSKLACDSFTQMAPRWKITKVNVEGQDAPGYKCTIRLPMLSPIREPIVGEVMKTKVYAKMAAALETCKILHQNGELSDNLLPKKLQLDLDDTYEEENNSSFGASGQLPFYARKIPNFKPVQPNAVCHVYMVRMKLTEVIERKVEVAEPIFDPDINSPYRFAIISENPNLEVIPFPVYTKSGKLTVTIEKPVIMNDLTPERLKLIEIFHESTFTDYLKISNNLTLRYGSSEICQYLLAPARKERNENYLLDWELMTKIMNEKYPPSNKKELKFKFVEALYSDTLVVPSTATHDMFHVLRIAQDMSIKSKFPKEEHATFGDFFSSKFHCKDMRQEDPLLELKHVWKPLVNMPGYFKRNAQFIEQSEIRLSNKLHFLPQLVTIKAYPGSLFRQASCMPCVLSRMNSVLNAEDLRLRVVKEARIGQLKCSWPALEFNRFKLPTSSNRSKSLSNNADSDGTYSKINFDEEPDLLQHPGPSPCFILEALTSKHYGDLMDLERLETIGDSALKYAVTMNLFCTYPRENEGKLTQRKAQQISNANLLTLGKKKNIPAIMCYSKMDPRLNWLPPGFKQPLGLEEAEVETGLLIPPELLEPSIWEMTREEVQETVRNLCVINSTMKESENSQKKLDGFPLKPASGLNLRMFHNMGNKSVADCVESLIGAYVISSGILGGLYFMNWLGLKVFQSNTTPKDLKSCFTVPPQIESILPNVEALKAKHFIGFDALEKTLNYKFTNRMYLLEALWHPSADAKPITDCYQRLEFLGDAVLDYIITRHLYEDPKYYSPGELTDLRMALVNNNFFATLAVENDLHKQMKYFSFNLLMSISKFVEKFKNGDMDFFEEIELKEPCDGAAEELEVPKVLGDVIESIAGAIYLDSGLSMQTVWNVFSRMMAKHMDAFRKCIPIHPVRHIYEEFSCHGGEVKFFAPEMTQAGKVKVKLCVRTQNTNFCFIGIAANKKTAKLTAAKLATKKLDKIF